MNIPIPAQLGIAVPLFAILGLLVIWMQKMIDRLQAEKEATNAKIMDKVIPALEQSAVATKALTEATSLLLNERAVDRALKNRDTS